MALPIKPGAIWLAAAAALSSLTVSSADLAVNDADARHDLPATVQGRLLDQSTGAPAADVPVVLVSADAPLPADLSGIHDPGVRTASDGTFDAPWRGGEPEPFLILLPRLWMSQAERLWTGVSEDARRDIDTDYQAVVKRVTIRRGAGEFQELGEITARKVPYYRANVAFPGNNCQPAIDYDVALSTRSGGEIGVTNMLGPVVCAEDFVVRGLRPGSYRIELLHEYATSDDRDWAIVDFEVTDHNVDLVFSGLPNGGQPAAPH